VGAIDTVDIKASPSIEAAVRDADIVATITTATSPIVDPSWIKPGALVLSMGGSQEFEPDTWRQATQHFVDELDYALYQGDLAAWSKSGAISTDQIRSSIVSIGEVAAGRWRGRHNPSEGIYAVIQGLTALDLALAHRIFTTRAS
jgi:ornithine cyclodeaminase/alanine dehydrogenase-like protein (mu-crystallin family)